MNTSFKVQMFAAVAALIGASCMLATSGCELIADFDRSLIDGGDLDAPDDDVVSPPFDANFDAPNALADGGSDADAAPATGDDAAGDAASAVDASDAADAAGQMDAADSADAPG